MLYQHSSNNSKYQPASWLPPANPSDPGKCNDQTQGTSQSAIKQYYLPKMGTRLSSMKPTTCESIQQPCNVAWLNGTNPTAPQKMPSNQFQCIPIPTMTNHTVSNWPKIHHTLCLNPLSPVEHNNQPMFMPVIHPLLCPTTKQSIFQYKPSNGISCHAPNITNHQSFSPTPANSWNSYPPYQS